VLNDIKDKFRITIASEGLGPQLCESMGFDHVWPRELGSYVSRRLADEPELKIGILRQSAEVLPIVAS